MSQNNFYIISGGPGSGKTSLLNYLFTNRGYRIMPEVARTIIAEEVSTGGDALPWGNRSSYINKMIVAERARYQQARQANNAVLFFDRSVIDALGYATLCGLPISPDMNHAAAALIYQSQVFMLPPWKEIYVTDSERKQDWDEAVATYHVLKQTYNSYDYRIIEVPHGDLAFRADFVLAHVGLP